MKEDDEAVKELKEDEERVIEAEKRKLVDADANKEALDDFKEQENPEGEQPAEEVDPDAPKPEEAKPEKIKLAMNKRIVGDVLQKVFEGIAGEGRFFKVDAKGAEAVIKNTLNNLKGDNI